MYEDMRCTRIRYVRIARATWYTLHSAQVWSANGPNLGTCLTPEVPPAALLSNAELVNAPWP